MRFPRLLSATLFLAISILSGCGPADSDRCEASRIWVDSVGEDEERSRIRVQWAKIDGSLDSLTSTVEGKRVADRASGSLERNETRYRDSILVVAGRARSQDGCVDWQASWIRGSFDRQAMATTLLRHLLPDTGYGAVEYRLEEHSGPVELSVEAVPTHPSASHQLRTVRFHLDSTRIRLAQP